MTHSIWNTIFIISLASAVIFSVISVILAVKYNIISLIRSNRSEKKNNFSKTDTSYFRNNAKEKPSSITEKIIKKTEEIPVKSNQVGTVIAGKCGNTSGTVVASDKFRTVKNIVVIHSDPSVVDKILQAENE